MTLAIVVPTIRPKSYGKFIAAWTPLFVKHKAEIIKVSDGDVPIVRSSTESLDAASLMGDNSDLIFNHTDACRNLGFAYIAMRRPKVTHIITLDDDTAPDPLYRDPIQAHLDILGQKVPTTWMSTVHWGLPYMRGFPYKARLESEVVVSHGVWTGVPDLDAKTQLKHPMKHFEGPFYVGPVPQGVYIPFCGMNIAFTREMLPRMYYAPMGQSVGYHRWSDILLGMSLVEHMRPDQALFTGASIVRHTRASDARKNLKLEKQSVSLGEYLHGGFIEHYNPRHEAYMDRYAALTSQWQALMEEWA